MRPSVPPRPACVSAIRAFRSWVLASFLLLPGTLPAATRLFVNGPIHTITGPVLPHAAVPVRDGLVTQVFPSMPRDPIADEIIDLRGSHLYPGLIALDTVLGLLEIEGVRATLDIE